MMPLLNIKRTIQESQPSALNSLVRSLMRTLLDEAGPGGNWKDVARRHFQSMAANALVEECALGEQQAMAFAASVLEPLARFAPLYRGAGETQLADLAEIAAGLGSDRLEEEALRRATETERDAVSRILHRTADTAASLRSGLGTDREAKAALRRLFCVGAPAFRLKLAIDGSRWISAQRGAQPLATLAHTPYDEMLAREMECLQDMVSAYLEERWFKDGRYRDLFGDIPQALLTVLGPAAFSGRNDEERYTRSLRLTASALLVSPLERLDQLGQDGGMKDDQQTVAELGRRIADWAEKILVGERSADIMPLRRSCLERLRSRHEASLDALLLDLRDRCAHATISV